MLRQLARLKYSVCGVTAEPRDVGLRSRHGTKIVCPDPRKDQEAWVETMLQLGARLPGRPALIPTADFFVLAMEAAAGCLEKEFRFHGFGTGVRSQLTSKKTTFELAAGADIPMPLTRVAESRDQILRFCEREAWPALIKPDFSFHWHAKESAEKVEGQKVLTAATPEELAEAFEKVRPFSPGAIIQELIPGPDRNLIYWAGFVGRGGRVRGRLVGSKVRVTPAHFGSASYVELVDRPDVEDLCEDFLRTIGYRGLCGVELKIDERDGTPKLIEVNPRFGLWDDLGIRAGVDLAGEAASALFGEEPQPRRTTDFKQTWVHARRDIRAFAEYRAEGSWSVYRWLRSLWPPTVVSDFPIRHDLPYAWSNFRSLAGDIIREMFSRGRPARVK